MMCSVCNIDHNKIITDITSGEIVCSICGAVLYDKMDDITRPEKLAFDSEEKNNRSRTGIPISLAIAGMGLATLISKNDLDASGRPLDTEVRAIMQRLRTWNSRAYSHGHDGRNFIKAFNELNIIKDKLVLSEAVVEKAAYIYRKARDERLIRGRSISGIMAAAIYAACREVGSPYTLKEIADASGSKRTDIAKNYRKLIIELDLKCPRADPMKCISKIANKANLSESTKRHAIQIMNEVSKRQIASGKDPTALAASVIYTSCLKTGEPTSQMRIANASGVTVMTIRKGFKDVKNKLLY
ncbi:MAG TPA: transcription initiation factor IIB [Nitrososphaeraceae archaeon]|nr:transcription initiation factor IIB [Nitrososphaeraceae archaeon]